MKTGKTPFVIRKWTVKTFWFFAVPAQRTWWFFARPRTTGAKCLVECKGEVLLVKIAYGHKKWTIPGGGAEKGETPLATALRELEEESGIRLETAEEIGTLFTNRNFRYDTLYAFHATVVEKRAPTVDGIEIQDAAWFPLEALPPDRSESTDKILAMLGAR